MKILNLYAGIGGNRKLWPHYVCPCGGYFEFDLGKYGCPNCCGKNIANLVEVTSIEYNDYIAGVYCDYFPNDTVLTTDAKDFLINHYKEFDFIWASPPCQTHSRGRQWRVSTTTPKYIDLSLYQIIIFLQSNYKGLWVVENVKPYYEPLIRPAKEIGRHLFWSNFKIGNLDIKERIDINENKERFGFDISKYELPFLRKDQILRNTINPEIGLHIFNAAQGIHTKKDEKQTNLFDD